MTDLDKDLEIVPEVGINMAETRAEIEIEDSSPGQFQEIEEVDQDQNPGLDLAPMYVQIGIDSYVVDVVSMTNLQENALMH